MTSNAHIKPHFRAEDEVEDVLEACLTIWHTAYDSQ